MLQLEIKPELKREHLPAKPHHKQPALSGEAFGTMINLSGRRRFTSQRLVLYAVLAAQGHEGALTTARDALKLFRDAHQALMQGSDELPGVFCDSLKTAYYGPTQGDRQIRDFLSLAQRTLDAVESELRQASVLLDELVKSATSLLAVLNKLTQVYEEEAKRHSLMLKRQRLAMMTDIERIARQARMVSFNAQIVAARAGMAGREFSVVALELSNITTELDELVREALDGVEH